jgi:histone H3
MAKHKESLPLGKRKSIRRNVMGVKASRKVVREVIHAQKQTHPPFRTAPFRRLVVSILQQVKPQVSRLSSGSVEALKIALLAKETDLLDIARRIATHAKRTTVQPADVALAKEILSMTTY